MADYWTTPKTNWITSDGIGYGDFNRIEANISANRDANFRKVQGFGYRIHNDIAGKDGVITVYPGSCYSSLGITHNIPIKMASAFVKNLTTWAQGNGSAFGGMASAVTVAAVTWYYIFVIMNPTDGSTEIMFDDNPSGTNVTSGTYTEKRRIGSFKTLQAGAYSSFDLLETYGIGDRTYIHQTFYGSGSQFANSGGINNAYQNVTLLLASDYALPALDVRADLNIISTDVDYGLISNHLGVFTTPSPFLSGGVPAGEFVFMRHAAGTGLADLAIMIDSTGKIKLAMYEAASGGSVEIRVRGFHDDRLQ